MIRAAVVGTGAAGLATAASLAVGGHSVRIANRGRRGLDEIRGRKGVRIENSDGSTITLPVRAAGSIAEAVTGSEVVILAIGGGGEGQLLLDLAPHLGAVDLIIVMSGRAGAGPACVQALEGIDDKVAAVVEMAFPFVASEERPGVVRIHGRKQWTAMTCTPEDRGEWALSTVKAMFDIEVELYPLLWPALHCIPGLIIPLLAISNAGRIARSEEFAFYLDGGFPEIDHLADAVDRERMTIGGELGLSMISSVVWFNKTYGLNCASPSGVFATSHSYKSRAAPNSLEHRYLIDHVPLCVVQLAILGQRIGVATPFLESIETFASELVGRDLWSPGLARASWMEPLLNSESGPYRLGKEDGKDVKQLSAIRHS
jgi:opine dehydrogenase